MLGFDAGPVPRVLRIVSALTLAAGVVMIILGGVRVGVTWDEPLHVQRFNNYLATGWYLGDGQVVDGEPVEGMKQQYVYGPATTILLHGLGVVTGVEEPQAAATTADAYLVRHLGVAAISLLGIAAVVATVRLLLRRWSWGLVSAAVMVGIPLWTGHSMFNIKDVPVATGFSLVTLGLVLLTREERHARAAVRFGAPLVLAAGMFLSIGTRPGMWTGTGASCGLFVAWLVVRRVRRQPGAEPPRDLWRFRDLLLGAAVAYGALWAIYPSVFGTPLISLTRSALGSANFLSASAPWTFIPTRMAFQLPILIDIFIVYGIVLAVRGIAARGSNRGSDRIRVGLVLSQLLVMPTVALVHGSFLSGDLRQVMFAAPPAVIMATLGMARLVALVRERYEIDRTGPPVVAALVGAALVVPMITQASIFPYNYTYYNAMADVTSLTLSGDYYRASGREIVAKIPTNGRIVCTPEDDGNGSVVRFAHLDGWVDCTDPASSPISPYVDERRGTAPDLDADEFWAVTLSSEGNVPENCVKIAGVTRRTLFKTLGLAAVSRCRSQFPVLSQELIELKDKSFRGYRLPNLGWRAIGVDGTLAGVRFIDGPGTMTFGLIPALKGRPVVLQVEATKQFDVDVSFGGVRVESTWVHQGVDRLIVALPAALVDRAVSGPLTLELVPRAKTAEDVKVLSLRVVAAPSPPVRTP